jgi:hypothetical protein
MPSCGTYTGFLLDCQYEYKISKAALVDRSVVEIALEVRLSSGFLRVLLASAKGENFTRVNPKRFSRRIPVPDHVDYYRQGYASSYTYRDK